LFKQNALQDLITNFQNEVKSLSGRLLEVSDTQKSLQDKLDTYQSDKDMLLDELEHSGAINDQIR
jgi:peptidoglycan hydrolase CwlO-like protein